MSLLAGVMTAILLQLLLALQAAASGPINLEGNEDGLRLGQGFLLWHDPSGEVGLDGADLNGLTGSLTNQSDGDSA